MVKPATTRSHKKAATKNVPVKAAKIEPSWLFHCHAGAKRVPITVYDNQDGTYSVLIGQQNHTRLTAEQALLIFAPEINTRIMRHEKFAP